MRRLRQGFWGVLLAALTALAGCGDDENGGQPIFGHVQINGGETFGLGNSYANDISVADDGVSHVTFIYDGVQTPQGLLQRRLKLHIEDLELNEPIDLDETNAELREVYLDQNNNPVQTIFKSDKVNGQIVMVAFEVGDPIQLSFSSDHAEGQHLNATFTNSPSGETRKFIEAQPGKYYFQHD